MALAKLSTYPQDDREMRCCKETALAGFEKRTWYSVSNCTEWLFKKIRQCETFFSVSLGCFGHVQCIEVKPVDLWITHASMREADALALVAAARRAKTIAKIIFLFILACSAIDLGRSPAERPTIIFAPLLHTMGLARLMCGATPVGNAQVFYHG
jgi:hypothetical protein